jgi:HD-GYP domain-containing protein (c-di-GMP phosphodiesterase class II)
MKIAELIELIRLLSAGLNYAALYDGEHVRVLDASRQFHRTFGDRLQQIREDGIFLGVVNHRLVWDGHPVLGATVVARRLIQTVDRLGIGGFLFHRGLEEEEVVRFLRLCNERGGSKGLSETRQIMSARGLKNISPSPRYGEPGWLGDQWGGIHGGRAVVSTPEDERLAEVNSLECYFSLVSNVEEIHAAAHHDRIPVTEPVRQAADTMVRCMGLDPSSLMHLSRYPDFESYTVGHSVRVSLFCVLVGQRAGLAVDDLVELGTAALLHDAGKGRIPHEILYKPSALDAAEREVMATHTTLGAEVLLRSHGAGPQSISAALCHHLRNDGRGYPEAPEWHRRSWTTQLIQTCDVFEALTAVRPYKPAMSPRRAYEIMLGDIAAFDPTCVGALFRATGLYPPGSRVRLTSGDEALVCRVTTDASAILDLSASGDGERIEVQELLSEDANRTPCDESVDPTVTAHSFDCGHDVRDPDVVAQHGH